MNVNGVYGYFEIKEKKVNGRKILVKGDYVVEGNVKDVYKRKEYYELRKKIINYIKNNSFVFDKSLD